MSDHDAEHGKSIIKIVDKRRFTASGDVRSDAPAEDPKKPPERPRDPRAPAAGGPPQAGAAKGEQPKGQSRGQPAASSDFLSFVASLATNAMAAMGMLPEAQARGMPVNPQMAREYIEIIAMLQERTRGNLSNEEEQALTRLLNELRMQFVEAAQQGAANAAGPGGPGRGGPRLPKR